VLALALLLCTSGSSTLSGQAVSNISARFQASWAGEDAGSLQGMMAPAVRLDVEGEAYLGVPPRQAAATLSRLFDRYAAAEPEMVRQRDPESGGEGGFAEFRWRPLTAQTAEPVPYVIFVVFRSVGSDLRIAELRVLR
jgi:hypothetical protein